MLKDWRHVCDLPPAQRTHYAELRLRLMENDRGYGVEVRKFVLSRGEKDFVPVSSPVMIPADCLPAAIAALQKANEIIANLKQAARA